MADTASNNFANHLFREGRWTSVYVAALLMLSTSSTYLFAMLASLMKDKFHYDFEELTTVSLMKDCGGTVGILVGLLAGEECIRTLVTAAASVTGITYTLLWVSLTERIHTPPFKLICVLILIGSSAQTFLQFQALARSIRKFPEDQARSSGLVTSLGSLSASTLSAVSRNSISEVLMIGWLPALVSPMFICTMGKKEVQVKQHDSDIIFKKLQYMISALAVFLTAMSLFENYDVFSTSYKATVIVTCILLSLTALLAIRQDFLVWREMRSPTSVEREEDPQHHPTILQSFISIRMLLLFIVHGLGVGSCEGMLDSLPIIAEAFEFNLTTIHLLVSLAGSSNFWGRVIGKHFFFKQKLSCEYILGIVIFISSIAHFLISHPINMSFFFSTVTIGFSHGIQLELIPMVIQEYFKNNYILFNYFLLSTIPISTYIIKIKIINYFYEKNMIYSKKYKKEKFFCQGNECFKHSFSLISLMLLIVSIIWCIFGIKKGRGHFT